MAAHVLLSLFVAVMRLARTSYIARSSRSSPLPDGHEGDHDAGLPELADCDEGAISGVFVRKASVMLIRIAPEDEADLRLEELPMHVLRVRHALPAIVRMQNLRPDLVLVGRRVPPRDLGHVLDAAFEIAAGAQQVGAFLGRDALHEWMLRMVGIVRQRRAQRRTAA